MTEHAVNRDKKPAATETSQSPEAPTTANPRYSLCSAIARHARFERASFHTPGHKGRQDFLFRSLTAAENGSDDGYLTAAGDLTELPGLDDLSAPAGVLADMEARAAALWGSRHAFLSVNGASAALIAAVLSAAGRGQITGRSTENSYALIPRNAHRSVVHALCLTHTQPIWYEPTFDGSWGLWTGADLPNFERALTEAVAQNLNLSFALVVSPTYGGALSDIASIAALTKPRDIPLIVDEAHGAHNIDSSAITCGADAVAHSWHKTLPALTQTGALHLPHGSLLSADSVRSHLNLISSSSPSYLFLASMEKTIALLESESGRRLLQSFESLSADFRRQLDEIEAVRVYDTGSGINYSHVLVAPALNSGQDSHNLYEFLQDRGVFAEAAMGSGVLFMLGLGSTKEDIDVAVATIKDFVSAHELNASGNAHAFPKRQPPFQPILPPHEAMSMPHETVPTGEALGRIAAQCLAPCPPGIPILIPGQKITEEVLALVSDKVLVVVAK